MKENTQFRGRSAPPKKRGPEKQLTTKRALAKFWAVDGIRRN